jgi:hypothetical protein
MHPNRASNNMHLPQQYPRGHKSPGARLLGIVNVEPFGSTTPFPELRKCVGYRFSTGALALGNVFMGQRPLVADSSMGHLSRRRLQQELGEPPEIKCDRPIERTNSHASRYLG